MHRCPVCAYPDLEEAPRSKSGGGSYEICPACGFQFGVDDDDKGISYEEWRNRWITKGTPWSSRGITQPDGWDPLKLLAVLKVVPDASATKKKAAKKVAKAPKKTVSKKKPKSTSRE